MYHNALQLSGQLACDFILEVCKYEITKAERALRITQNEIAPLR